LFSNLRAEKLPLHSAFFGRVDLGLHGGLAEVEAFVVVEV
jgi:hypothetical protein